jgi:hypothetical protein
MTVTAVCDKMLRLIKSIMNICCLIHCKNGRKLFMGEFLADIHAFNLTDNDFCSGRNRYACKSCNLRSGLTYDFSVKRAVDDNGLSDLLCLLRIKEVAASVSKLSLNCVVDILTDCSEAQIIPLSNVFE